MPSPPDVSPDLPPALWRATLAALGRLPQGVLSRGFGRLADLPLPRTARAPVLGALARVLGIDVSEAERPLEAYPSMNAFFVRRLRPGLRRWPEEQGVAGSPVDGVAGRSGIIEEGRLLQAKRRWYAAAELLGDDDEAERFRGGSFLTLYLSPRHYHRIHAPCGDVIPLARHVPGALLPVNAAAVAHVPDLFARNERLLCMIDGPLGRVAVVAVGAYNVGRISAGFDPAWAGGGSVTNRRNASPDVRYYDPPLSVSPGEEIMAFHLGSTVILLFEPGAARLAHGLEPGTEVRLGQPIARAP